MVDSSFFSAFVYSIEKAMLSMLGSTCRFSSRKPSTGGRHVAGVVYLSGRAHGRLALSFPKDTAVRVVAEMLGVDSKEVTERLLRDGVAEITNIVAGNAKALLAGSPHAFRASLPRVVLGVSEFPGTAPGEQTMSRNFITSLGPLSMAVWLTPAHSLAPNQTN